MLYNCGFQVEIQYKEGTYLGGSGGLCNIIPSFVSKKQVAQEFLEYFWFKQIIFETKLDYLQAFIKQQLFKITLKKDYFQ